MPAPADVQTANHGSTVGRAENGDTVTLTFASTVNPDLVMSGWDGSATSVTVVLTHFSGGDVLTIQTPGGSTLWALGGVDLQGHFTNGASFTGSTMTLSDDTVTVVLGTAGAGTMFTVVTPGTMSWLAPTGFASETGLLDAEF
jgi:hypothetical protein